MYVLYVCMYVCIYVVCIYVCMYACSYVCMNVIMYIFYLVQLTVVGTHILLCNVLYGLVSFEIISYKK